VSGFLFHICFIFSVLICVAALCRILIQLDHTNLTGTLLTDYRCTRRWALLGGRRFTLLHR
jgi:ABC-type transport system involved in cytochrome c biogenesis permease component